MVSQMFHRSAYRVLRLVFSRRTLYLMRFDLVRFRARLKHYGDSNLTPPYEKLHFGCGTQRFPGWLNVDVVNSDYDLDLASGKLPWKDNTFQVAVSRHVIEHLELLDELIPLLRELHRVLQPGGTIWLSCPDIEKVCRSYLAKGMTDIQEYRSQTIGPVKSLPGAMPPFDNVNLEAPSPLLGEVPTCYTINDSFHQWGQHKNLFDFAVLEWALQQTGFVDVKRIVEADLLSAFPEYQSRNDDIESIYVRATAK